MSKIEPKTDLAKTVRSTGEALRAAPEASAGSIEAQAFGPCHIVRLEDGTTLLACKTEVLAALGVNLDIACPIVTRLPPGRTLYAH